MEMSLALLYETFKDAFGSSLCGSCLNCAIFQKYKCFLLLL